MLSQRASAITIDLRPPRWWKGLRVFFLVTGVLNVVIGVANVALVTWLAMHGQSLDVAGVVTGAFLMAAGAFLVQQVRRTGRYRGMPLVLEEAHAVLPRLRTNESVRVAYEDVGKIHFMKNPALRMRIFVRTTQGDFFVHRAWLPTDWTLEKLVAELVQRRDAARAAKAKAASAPEG